VGLTELVDVCRTPVPRPDIRTEPLHERTHEDERLDLVRSAHQKLIQIDERNEKAFGRFLELLNEQMERQRRSQT